MIDRSRFRREFSPRINNLKSRDSGPLDGASLSPVSLIGLNAAGSNTCEGSFRPPFSTGIQTVFLKASDKPT